MEKTTHQIEKNVSASFAYVKKDMLMLNDAFSDLHDKVQHLSLNHAMLLGEIEKLRNEVAGKKSSVKGKTKVSKRDDLTKIKGVGPAIVRLLGKYGIDSFEKMTKVTVKDLREILEEGGSRFRMHDPSTWVEQARKLVK